MRIDQRYLACEADYLSGAAQLDGRAAIYNPGCGNAPWRQAAGMRWTRLRLRRRYLTHHPDIDRRATRRPSIAQRIDRGNGLDPSTQTITVFAMAALGACCGSRLANDLGGGGWWASMSLMISLELCSLSYDYSQV